MHLLLDPYCLLNWFNNFNFFCFSHEIMGINLFSFGFFIRTCQIFCLIFLRYEVVERTNSEIALQIIHTYSTATWFLLFASMISSFCIFLFFMWNYWCELDFILFFHKNLSETLLIFLRFRVIKWRSSEIT